MGSNSINLTVRFLLEMAALVSFGMLAYKNIAGSLRIPSTIVFPLLAAVFWGLFNVPGDPSRSGAAPVPVSGMLRLAIEALIFALATWGFIQSQGIKFGLVYLFVIIIHYALSYDRIIWLLQK
jgi:hypothetical protein